MRKLQLSRQANITGYCGAKLRKKDRTCRHPAGWGTDHPGVGRCRLHGGASLCGPANPAFKHGLRSRYLPLPGDDTEPVTEEELLTATPEVVALIRHAEHILKQSDRLDPLVIMNILLMVLKGKRTMQEMARKVELSGPQAELVAELAGRLVSAIEEAQISDDAKREIARALRQRVEHDASSTD